MPGGRRETPIIRNDGTGGGGGGPSKLRTEIVWVITVGLLIGSVFGLLYPSRFFNISAPRTLPTNISRVVSSTCKPSERFKMLRSEYIEVSEKNAKLKKDVRELNFKLRLIEQGKDPAGTQVLSLGEPQKAGPFGTVKGIRTNPAVIPDDSVNRRLAKLLGTIAIKRELIVTFADPTEKDLLEVWFTSIKKVGMKNYLVVTMDDEIAKFCHANVVPYYKMESNEANGSNLEISGLKFQVLREFLRLGYGVLVSDLDAVFLQNPFEHLVRDSDVESTSDGHDNNTAYGFDDGFDDPSMGWARAVHTIRIWMYNSGFFYIRPTIPSIELVDRVASRVSQDENLWDQGVFNEEIFMPSHPGHEGIYASRRTMDIHLFMNSKVLFTSVRKDADLLSKLRPVIVHVNYHSDKLERMTAIVEYYVNGKVDALRDFPDGSE